MGRASGENLRVEANQFCKFIGSPSEGEAIYEWGVEGKGVRTLPLKSTQMQTPAESRPWDNHESHELDAVKIGIEPKYIWLQGSLSSRI